MRAAANSSLESPDTPNLFPPGVVWTNGSLIRSERATLHVLSHATQRGSAVFDVVKVVQIEVGGLAVPHAIGLPQHLGRFMNSMSLMGMATPYSVEELMTAVSTVVGANPGAAVLKLVAAWEEIPLRALPVSLVPRIWIAALLPEPNDDAPKPSGIRLRTSTAPKMPASILPPNLKVAASYAAGVRLRMAAVEAGFDDVLFKTQDGYLAEGTTQSLAVVQGASPDVATLLLPPLDEVLDSITRRMVLDIADWAGIPVVRRNVEWSEVEQADELYLSSANGSVMAVSCLDDRVYPSPGPVSAFLAAEADRVEAGSHELSGRWLTAL